MCLNITDYQTKRLQRHFAKKKTLVAYKVLNKCGQSTCMGYRYRAGWNRSDRCLRSVSPYEKWYLSVDNGIHVFVNKSDAVKNAKRWATCRVIAVTCYADDFVTAGKNNGTTSGAVFTKVFLTKREARKIHG